MSKPGPTSHPLDGPWGRMLLLGAVLALCLPLLLDTYHKAVSDWVHRDDYAPVLLWLAGDASQLPTSPFGYRPLSVVPAWPLYETLPLYRLSHGMDRSLPWLRATQALVLVSWLSVGALTLTVFATARDKLQTSVPSALVAGLGAVLVVQYTGVVGTDPIGLLGVAVAWYFLDRPRVFAALVLASVLLNEKIALLLAVVLLARWLRGDRRPLPLAASGLAVLAYLALRVLGPLEGAGHQLDPTAFGAQLLATVRSDFTANGVFRALLPSAVGFGGFALAWVGNRGRPHPWARPEDVVGAVALFAIAHLLATNVGRLVLYTAPFFLPALALALDRSLERPER